MELHACNQIQNLINYSFYEKSASAPDGAKLKSDINMIQTEIRFEKNYQRD